MTLNRSNRRYVNRDAIIRAGLGAELDKLLPDAPRVIILLEDVDGQISQEWRNLIDDALRRLETFLYNPTPQKEQVKE